MYDGILAQLQGLEERVARHHGHDPVGLRIPITAEDVGYVIEEVYHGRSVVSGLASRLALTRWRLPAGEWIDRKTPGQKADKLALGDLVCMTKDEMLRHEKEVLKEGKTPEEVYDKEVRRGGGEEDDGGEALQRSAHVSLSCPLHNNNYHISLQSRTE